MFTVIDKIGDKFYVKIATVWYGLYMFEFETEKSAENFSDGFSTWMGEYWGF